MKYKVYFDFKSSDYLTKRTFNSFEDADNYRNEKMNECGDVWEAWVTDENGNIIEQ